MAKTAFGTLWERQVLSRVLDWGMRGVEPTRQDVLKPVRGRVLEIGFGTGSSLPYYGPDIEELVAVEPATGLAQIGRSRLNQWSNERNTKASLIEQSATWPLPVDAESFDSVVILFVLCSVERLDELLAQAHRALKPNGSIFLAEHVAADKDPQPHPYREKAQRIIRPAWRLALGGCDPHKSLDGVLERNGFDSSHLQHTELDLVWVVRSGLVGKAPKRLFRRISGYCPHDFARPLFIHLQPMTVCPHGSTISSVFNHHEYML